MSKDEEFKTMTTKGKSKIVKFLFTTKISCYVILPSYDKVLDTG